MVRLLFEVFGSVRISASCLRAKVCQLRVTVAGGRFVRLPWLDGSDPQFAFPLRHKN